MESDKKVLFQKKHPLIKIKRYPIYISSWLANPSMVGSDSMLLFFSAVGGGASFGILMKGTMDESKLHSWKTMDSIFFQLFHRGFSNGN
jgi:hypothetical protein